MVFSANCQGEKSPWPHSICFLTKKSVAIARVRWKGASAAEAAGPLPNLLLRMIPHSSAPHLGHDEIFAKSKGGEGLSISLTQPMILL